jgi:uncharacterized membrane protein YfcA
LTLERWQVLALAAVGLIAGTVDAIAGGGGLLTLPALLSCGLPPHVALGTNKGQSVFGSLASLVRYQRAGLVERRWVVSSLAGGASGAVAGALLVSRLNPDRLRWVVLFLLVGVGLFVAVRPPLELREGWVVRGQRWVALALALGLGAYDGFFGPGVGTFLIMAFVLFFGTPLARASANAKVVNFASNFGAVCLFAVQGTVLWRLALPMALSQTAGGFLGAHLTVRGGDRLVRWILLGVVVALVVKLAASQL